MGETYVAPNYMFDRPRGEYFRMRELTERDDWFFTAGWDFLGYHATIFRGRESLAVKLRGKEALKLLLIQDELKAEAKARTWRKKNARKAATLDAAWWP
jgi:hypothetical protein